MNAHPSSLSDREQEDKADDTKDAAVDEWAVHEHAEVGINGLTEDETNATASVAGLVNGCVTTTETEAK